VQQHVYRVMPSWIGAEELPVGHMRQRGERVPVPRMWLGERPLHRGPRQPAFDLRVIVNIDVVVIIDEAVPQRLAEDGPDQRDKTDTDDDARRAGSLAFR
jgi:hypothetical protein